MDIAEFNIHRPVRSVEGWETLRLVEEREILPPPKAGISMRAYLPEKPGAGPVMTIDDVPVSIAHKSDDPLGNIERVDAPTPLACAYHVLAGVDQAEAAANDRLAGTDLRDLVVDLIKRQDPLAIDWAQILGVPGLGVSAVFQIAQLGLRRALVNAFNVKVQKGPDFEKAAVLTRRALIASLLEFYLDQLAKLDAETVFHLLNRRPVVLAAITRPKMAPRAQVKLVREAMVSDLRVVRREWAGYVASEIANIRNVMKGEFYEQRDDTVRETETTTTAEQESRQLDEQESQAKFDSELSQEVNTQLGVTINGHAEASAEFKYPIATARVSGGVDAGLSLQRSERQSSTIAREAVSRALSRVESMTRESRSRRELMRSEQHFRYGVDNTGGDNVHAVYRWVDRVDTYQLFRFADRFLLEFQIPDPAEFYRWRTERTAQTASAVDKPPEAWALTVDEIQPDKLVELAARYHATSLEAAPEDTISVVRALTVEIGKEGAPDWSKNETNPPTASKELEIPIPSDYGATTVFYEGEGYPVMSNWMDTNGRPVTGFRSSFATVGIGDVSMLYWNGGIENKGTPQMKFKGTHQSQSDPGVVKEVQSEDPPYGRALLPIGAGTGIDPDTESVQISPPAVNLVKVAVTTVGVLSATVTFRVECSVTEEAKATWRLGVYDALFAAWSQWKRDYATAQQRQAFSGTSAADAGSSSRNDQIVREELKRETISWLLDESTFAGRPALKPHPANRPRDAAFQDINFDQARADAPTIQFFEQAFEWANLSYVFYPYFWTSREEWEKRSQITANDPEFERFLRAGSARVIVPARPGFNDAVKNWLLWKTPFISGQLPSPDDPLYVSIDREIRDLTAPPEGGVPEDTWQTRVSTTMLYLEEQGDLPFVNDLHELPAPQGVPYVPEPVIALP